MPARPRHSTVANAAAGFLTDYSGWVIAAIMGITLLLVPPIFLMRPAEMAADDPGGPVFDLQDAIGEKFAFKIHAASFIVEDRRGDILRQAPLWELYRNQQALRSSELGAFLYNGYDADTGRRLQGVFTIADAVNDVLRLDRSGGVTLETATDRQVKQAVARVMDSPAGEFLRVSLSKDASARIATVDGRETEEWQAAALSVFVAADNALLGGGPMMFGTLNMDDVTLEKERFNRRALELLRGEQENYRLWGVSIDLNLTSIEQGRGAAPFIAATVVLVLVVVGVALRSLRAVVLGFFGLLMLLVWLKGISNLIGLKSSLASDYIVPIAMISLGADFLIHAVARYREERRRTPIPARALRLALAGVLGALTLATLSDAIAFLANMTAGIESIIAFGLAAGIAVLSGFVIMGVFIPLVLMRLDERRAPRDAEESGGASALSNSLGGGVSASERGIARLVAKLADIPRIVLPVTAAITALAVYMSFQLEPTLDIKDFFDSNSDFVVGLDKMDQHTSPAITGEPAVIYIQGDLTAPEALDAIRALLERLGKNENLGRNEDGSVVTYYRTALDLLRRLTASEYARTRVLEAEGVAITDADADGLPDTPEQTRAAYRYMTANGVPLDEKTVAYDSIQVRQTLHVDGNEQAAILVIGVLGSREQANLAPARESLERDLAPLGEAPAIAAYGLTGTPFTREATLTATTRALTRSLPVAAVLCLLLMTLWMRSLAFAAVTIIPVGLVVSWLYAFMHLAGYSLNFVTATIAAVSIGVGIDYSIHMTQRFRQELTRRPDPREALRQAASGTGVALAGSAASSIAGFVVLGFAPMPLFSTYGILSAAMILMAAAAALLVLPSLLVIVARRKT